MKQIDNKKMEDLNKELDRLEQICYDYKKNKSFNTQLILTVIQCLVLYCVKYVIENNLDIGFSMFTVKYIEIGLIVSIIFGWLNHYLEYHTTNMKLFKIAQISIWIIEIIMIIIFLILLF